MFSKFEDCGIIFINIYPPLCNYSLLGSTVKDRKNLDVYA